MVFRVYSVSSEKNSFWSLFSINTRLILFNTLFFIFVSILVFTNLLSIDFVAIKPSNILDGKYLWTFLTSMFMHGGVLHLFANMFSLFFIGKFVEQIIGRKRYFWFYIFSGLFAGLFFVLISYGFNFVGAVKIGEVIIDLTKDFTTYAVGASGALFGLIGLLMILTPNLPVYVMLIPIPIKMKYAAPGILIILWLISITGGINIGNTAHLGGLIAGLVYGVYLKNKFPKKTIWITQHFK